MLQAWPSTTAAPIDGRPQCSTPAARSARHARGLLTRSRCAPTHIRRGLSQKARRNPARRLRRVTARSDLDARRPVSRAGTPDVQILAQPRVGRRSDFDLAGPEVNREQRRGGAGGSGRPRSPQFCTIDPPLMIARPATARWCAVAPAQGRVRRPPSAEGRAGTHQGRLATSADTTAAEMAPPGQSGMPASRSASRYFRTLEADKWGGL